MLDPPPIAAVSGKLEKVIESALRGNSVSARTRAIFGLRADGSAPARAALEQVLREDASALVRHEAAYLLGQLGDFGAYGALEASLRDAGEDPMVRHEAAEALGAIGDARAAPILREFTAPAVAPREVTETCEIALARIAWLEDQGADGGSGGPGAAPAVPYTSVDPAPPAAGAVAQLAAALADPAQSLPERYRAMFGLRNAGGEAAVLALAKGLADAAAGALFRHEIAYVLGQMQHPAAVDALAASLGKTDEHEMVRHEAAEALGSIGTKASRAVLERFKHDPSVVVRESIAVALDIDDYTNSSDFQYADSVEGARAVKDPVAT